MNKYLSFGAFWIFTAAWLFDLAGHPDIAGLMNVGLMWLSLAAVAGRGSTYKEEK